MNPLDGTVIRLGIYIGQLETQVQELHRQLLDKSKELEECIVPAKLWEKHIASLELRAQLERAQHEQETE